MCFNDAEILTGFPLNKFERGYPLGRRSDKVFSVLLVAIQNYPKQVKESNYHENVLKISYPYLTP